MALRLHGTTPEDGRGELFKTRDQVMQTLAGIRQIPYVPCVLFSPPLFGCDSSSMVWGGGHDVVPSLQQQEPVAFTFGGIGGIGSGIQQQAADAAAAAALSSFYSGSGGGGVPSPRSNLSASSGGKAAGGKAAAAANPFGGIAAVLRSPITLPPLGAAAAAGTGKICCQHIYENHSLSYFCLLQQVLLLLLLLARPRAAR